MNNIFSVYGEGILLSGIVDSFFCVRVLFIYSKNFVPFGGRVATLAGLGVE